MIYHSISIGRFLPVFPRFQIPDYDLPISHKLMLFIINIRDYKDKYNHLGIEKERNQDDIDILLLIYQKYLQHQSHNINKDIYSIWFSGQINFDYKH